MEHTRINTSGPELFPKSLLPSEDQGLPLTGLSEKTLKASGSIVRIRAGFPKPSIEARAGIWMNWWLLTM